MADTSIINRLQQVDVVNPLLLAAQMGRQNQQGQLADLQIQGQKQQNTAQGAASRREALKLIAQDAVTFDNLVQQGDMQAAAMVGQEIKRTMTDFQMDTSKTDEMLSLFNKPDQLKQASSQMRKSLESMLPKIFDDVLSTSNGQAVTRNAQTGQVTAQPIPGYQSPAPDPLDAARLEGQQLQNQRARKDLDQQPDPLDAYIQQLEVQNQQLQNQRLQGQIQTDQQSAQIAQQNAAVKQQENEQRQASMQNEAIRAYELTGMLLGNAEGLAGATGPISSMFPTFREKTADFEANMRELESLLTLGNLNRLSGVLSDSDIRLLSTAASGLSAEASEDRMNKKLNQIGSVLSQNPAVLQMIQGRTQTDIPTVPGQPGAQTATNPQTGERIILRNGRWEPFNG